MTVAAATEARAGRPRDPQVEQRVFAAARVVFAERGWVGFGFNHVARQAGVGKGALYRRWESPADLLLDALEDQVYEAQAVAGSTMREQLADLGVRILRQYSTPAGFAFLRMFVESAAHPELYEQFRKRVLVPSYLQQFKVIERAAARGEIPPDTDPAELMDLVHGVALSRAMVTLQDRGDVSEFDVRAYMDRIVDRLLRP